MVISDTGYGAIYLVIFLIAALKIASESAENGLFVWPISLKMITFLTVGLFAICAYGFICLESTSDVFGQLYPYLLIVCTLPFVWGLIYRFWILPSWLVGFDLLTRKIIRLEELYLVPGERTPDDEQAFKSLPGLDNIFHRIHLMIEAQEKGEAVKTLVNEENLLKTGMDETGHYRVGCLNPECNCKIPFLFTEENYSCPCECGAVVQIKRVDDRALITTRLKYPIIGPSNWQRYNIASGYELMARLYRMMGDTDQAILVLNQALSWAYALHVQYPKNIEYMDLLSAIHFDLGEIYHVIGDHSLAKFCYSTTCNYDNMSGNKSNMQLVQELITQLG